MISDICKKHNLEKNEEIYNKNNNLIFSCLCVDRQVIVKLLDDYSKKTDRFYNECKFYEENINNYNKYLVDEINGMKFLIMPKFNSIKNSEFGLSHLPMEKMIIFLKQIQLIHDKGISHRDIKLPNIMLDDHQNLVLIDFGLVKFRDCQNENRLTKIEEKISNKFYPEVIIRNHGITIRYPYLFDLIALSKLFYEFIGGNLDNKTRESSIDEYTIINTIHKSTNSFDTINVNKLGRLLSDITKIKLENVSANTLNEMIILIEKIWENRVAEKSPEWFYYNDNFIEEVLCSNENLNILFDDVSGLKFDGIKEGVIRVSKNNINFRGKINQVCIEEENNIRLIRISFFKQDIELQNPVDLFGKEAINKQFNREILIVKQEIKKGVFL